MKKKTAGKVMPLPSVGPVQVKPPQPRTLEQMRPEDLHGKVLQLEVSAVAIENVIRQEIPPHLMGALDLRLTDIEVSHKLGAPKIAVWVSFSPRVQPQPKPTQPSVQG